MASPFVFDPTNLLVLPGMVVGNFRFADWRGSYNRSGAFGVAGELARSAVGANTIPFFIPVDSGWEFRDVQALLARYGITAWAVGYFKGEMHFSVKQRQAHWAQYVLLREGIPLLHGLLDGSRANPSATGHGSPESAAAEDVDLPRWLTGAYNWALGRDEASPAQTPQLPSPRAASPSEHGTTGRLPVIICDGSIVDKS